MTEKTCYKKFAKVTVIKQGSFIRDLFMFYRYEFCTLLIIVSNSFYSRASPWFGVLFSNQFLQTGCTIYFTFLGRTSLRWSKSWRSIQGKQHTLIDLGNSDVLAMQCFCSHKMKKIERRESDRNSLLSN